MTYDPDAPAGTVGEVTSEQLWYRLEEFLHEVVPVAEEAGVRLAAHPDDPPLPSLRGTARLVNKPELYQRLLDIHPSPSNALEFCQGTIAEMNGEMDVYEAIDTYSKSGQIAYVHFRNVRGKVPEYHEVFVDEGDVDMVRALRLYHQQRLRRRDHPRPHAADGLRRLLARRHGLRPRLDGRRPPLHRGRASSLDAVAEASALQRPIADGLDHPLGVVPFVLFRTARGQVVPGIRVAHARDHLANRFGHQLGLILVDVVAALAGHEETRIRDEGGQVLVRRSQERIPLCGRELLRLRRQGERQAVGQDGQGHRP